MEQIIFIVIGVLLLVLSFFDLVRKKVPMLPIAIVGIALCIYQIYQKGTMTVLLGMLPGICVWVISRLSRGAIGDGDAVVLCLTGVTVGLWSNVEIFLVSLILSSVVSLYLVVVRHVGRKYTIAYIPFLTTAYWILGLMR